MTAIGLVALLVLGTVGVSMPGFSLLAAGPTLLLLGISPLG